MNIGQMDMEPTDIVYGNRANFFKKHFVLPLYLFKKISIIDI